jgi:hypothetical protein
MQQDAQHHCLIYDGAPSRQLTALAAFTKQKLDENFRCLYLNSPTMVAGMRSYLAALDVDVTAAAQQGRLVLSSETAVSADGAFDAAVMIARLDAAVTQAVEEGYAGLFATGDLTWEFGPRHDFSALLQYEWELERLFRKHPVLCGVCQYHADTLPRDALRQGLVSHPKLFINETLSVINKFHAGNAQDAALAAQNPQLDAELAKLGGGDK